MQNLSPVAVGSNVDPADRVSTINFINRFSWLFDAWDTDGMVEAFLPDDVTYHTHGFNRGQTQTRRFFQRLYPYTVPTVSRHTRPTRSSTVTV